MSELATVKDLVRRYNAAHEAYSELNNIKEQLLPLLIRHSLTKTKFSFGDRTLSYNKYNAYNGINKGCLREYLHNRHPTIDAEKFIEELYASRKQHSVETIQVIKK